ncbi:MAG: RidA family protein [Gammaproteobacteria bacterium]|nr:RidA family protein [Gammaproteobacteria bacterium]MDP2139574.1 RidA family protein [Gammaproteobacteria bacterium]MDP2346547.1 RidA family protein [Gammaproteobacteria bacterium]
MSHNNIIDTPLAPAAIGPYSQAVRVGNLVFFSGQIPLDPASMTIVSGDIEAQTVQVLDNMKAVAVAAGGNLKHIVKLTIFLTDLADFATVNETMKKYFDAPYPARSTVQVAALPKGAAIEVEAIMALPTAG